MGECKNAADPKKKNFRVGCVFIVRPEWLRHSEGSRPKEEKFSGRLRFCLRQANIAHGHRGNPWPSHRGYIAGWLPWLVGEGPDSGGGSGA